MHNVKAFGGFDRFFLKIGYIMAKYTFTAQSSRQFLPLLFNPPLLHMKEGLNVKTSETFSSRGIQIIIT